MIGNLANSDLVYYPRNFLFVFQEVELPSADGRSELPRKEVIQAHLPVHLPCYDFVPVTSPTLDSALPYGLGYWLQVLPAPMT